MSEDKFLYEHAFGYNSEENFGYNCRICGFKMDNMPWSIDEKYGLDEICPCCGCQSGLNDDSPEFIRENRSNWGVGQNMKWHNPERKPKNWSWQQ